MLSSFVIGLAAGARALTPLATVSDAARRGLLSTNNGAPIWLGAPLATLSISLLAAGELLGDKLHSAPDRTSPAGLLARLVSAGVCGAALAPRRRASLGAALGVASAILAAYSSFALRQNAMRRFSQTGTGLIEDGLTSSCPILPCDWSDG